MSAQRSALVRTDYLIDGAYHQGARARSDDADQEQQTSVASLSRGARYRGSPRADHLRSVLARSKIG